MIEAKAEVKCDYSIELNLFCDNIQVHSINKLSTWHICVISVRNKQCDKEDAINIKY